MYHQCLELKNYWVSSLSLSVFGYWMYIWLFGFGFNCFGTLGLSSINSAVCSYLKNHYVQLERHVVLALLLLVSIVEDCSLLFIMQLLVTFSRMPILTVFNYYYRLSFNGNGILKHFCILSTLRMLDRLVSISE